MQNLIDILKEVGLDEKEATIYLTLLTVGCNPASTVAKRIGQNRSSCYMMLEKLIQKGFVQKIIKGNIAYFQAVEINYLLKRIKIKYGETLIRIEEMRDAVNRLNKINNFPEIRPKVMFYQDKSGIQNIMEDALTAKNAIRAYASLDELIALFPNYFTQYLQRRASKGLFIKIIFPASIKSFHHKKRDELELRESRLIPEEFNFHLNILIYDHKMAIISLKEYFGIVIESKEMTDSQKRIFDIIWEVAKPYDERLTAEFEKALKEKQKD